MKLKRKEKMGKNRGKNILKLVSPALFSLLLLLLFIIPANALSLSDIPNYTIEENRTLRFNIHAANYNNTVIFSIQPEKGTLTKINDTLAAFEWTPLTGETGTYQFTFSVADHTESVSKQNTITVTKLNIPPIIIDATTEVQSTPQITLNVETNKACTCKYSMSNKNYTQMEYTLAQTNTEKTLHEGKTPTLSQGVSTIYILCNDEAGNYMTSARQIAVNINSKPTASITLNPEPPLREGTIKIELTISEPLISAPELKYYFDDDAGLRDIALIGSGTNWEGYLIIKDSESERVGSFTFRGYDLTNNEGTEITSGKLFLIDTQNPRSIQSITIENLDDEIKLEWEKPESENVEKYKIYKKSGSGGVEEVDYLDSADEEEFYDDEVEYNIGYYYRVSIVDKAGNEGPMSKEVFTTHIPVIDTNKPIFIPESETQDKLDSKLEYVLNTELQKVDNIQKDIAKAEETISRTLGSDNIDALEALNALNILTENKNRINDLRKDLEDLKTQYIEESDFNSLVSDIMNDINSTLKATPMEVKVLDSSSYQEFTNDEKTNSIITNYLNEYYPTLSDKEKTAKIEETKKFQDAVVVNVKIIKGETKYPEETKPFAIVKKTFNSDTDLGKILLLENIPSNVGSISSVEFSEQPFFNEENVFWSVENLNGKKTTYVIYSELNMADLKTVKSIVLNEQDIINKTQETKQNEITGDSINVPELNAAADKHSGFFLALIVAGILVICGLFAYYIYWSEAESGSKKEDKNKDNKGTIFNISAALFKKRKSILPDDSHRKISIEKPEESVHQNIDNVEFRRIEPMHQLVEHQLKYVDHNNLNIPTPPTNKSQEQYKESAEKHIGKESAPSFKELEVLQNKLAELRNKTNIDDLDEFDALRTKTYEIKRLCEELEEQSVIEFTNKTRANLEKSLLYIARHVPMDSARNKYKLTEETGSGSYNERTGKEKEEKKENSGETSRKPEPVRELTELQLINQEANTFELNKIKINTNNFSEKAPEGREFVFQDGDRIQTIKDLREKLSNVSDSMFNDYVTSSKNDFANWIGDVFRDYDLAYKIRNTSSRKELIELLNTF